MRQVKISKYEAGQRFDKWLTKYLDQAPKSFLYKMLRKKNITLNGKKSDGSDKVSEGDEITFFLSEETLEKFSKKPTLLFQKRKENLDILYEDEHILLINKPCGMLSQKARPEDTSLVEHITGYLLETGWISQDFRQGFRPSISNRLDRNTSGIVVAGKSLAGLQAMAEIFQNRSLHKYYLCMVQGKMEGTCLLEGYLTKHPQTNQVKITRDQRERDALPIKTKYCVISGNEKAALVLVELITGRAHQIRAHLASIGHPIWGDLKYGGKPYGNVKHQLLHSYRLEMPKLSGEFAYLSEKVFLAKPPRQFENIRKELGLDYGNLEF